MNTKETHIIINNEIDFSDEFGKSYDYYNSIKHALIHFKKINFNLLEPKELRTAKANKIIFENCIFGQLHYLNLSLCDEIQILNQEVDSYLISNIFQIRKIYLDNNSISSLYFLSNRQYDLLSLKNNNIKGQLNTLGKCIISTLMLEELGKYNLSDLEYLKLKLESRQIKKLFFNDTEIDNKKLFYLERKIKIQKLIKQNA